MGITAAVRDVRTIKLLLEGAEAEARASGEPTPGPEHLLLAAVALPDGSAGRALERVGVDVERLRTTIGQTHADALDPLGVEAGPAVGLRSPATGALRATPQAQQVFQEAVTLSKATRPHRLTGAHVVAAACALSRGTTARVLAALGVDRDRLREVALIEAHAD